MAQMFKYNINKLCLENPQRIVLPEALDPRILTAAAKISQRGQANIILLGEEPRIQTLASRLHLDISGVRCYCLGHTHARTRDLWSDDELSPCFLPIVHM